VNRIDRFFAQKPDGAGKKFFVALVTGGDPNIETTAHLIRTIAKAGADIIEIGIPFSDPIAEGPVIQAASLRALAAGCTTERLFDMVEDLRRDVDIPLLFMTYANPVFAYGKERFLRRCVQCGIDGLIIPDTPFEEKEEFAGVCREHNVRLISMVAPTSRHRAAQIARGAEGFLCCVASLGGTDMRPQLMEEISQVIANARSVSDIPCAVSFDISTPEQAQQMALCGDGIIVDSAIGNIIAQYGEDSEEPVARYVESIKKALQEISV
jgi:tryptophan synthase alpha chain